MARKSKLTPEKREEIVGKIAGGSYAKVAAESSGITERTFYMWLAKGEEAATGAYRDFYDAVKAAEYEAELKGVEEWTRQGQKDWRAWMEFLQRRYPSRWANVQKVEVQVEKEFEQMLGVLEEGLEPNEFRRVAGILAGSKTLPTRQGP